LNFIEFLSEKRGHTLALFVHVISLHTSIYEKRRVVMIEYAIKICSNKKRKEKVNHYSSLEFI